MNPASNKPGSGGREAADDAELNGGNKKTPSTDMQPEDAGTADSGNAGSTKAGRGNAAEIAMKQTGKTGNETGGKR
ncbi:MAG TPA: hypothetical protein VN649_10420 [Ramlibacter sp.]|nr:hypothetical protein [Ramlibacter sp.]